MESFTKTLSIIGAGNMGESLIRGVIQKDYPPHRIWASNRQQSKLTALAKRFGINTTTDNQFAFTEADIVILAVKPQQMREVVLPLRSVIERHQPLIISIAAGIRTSTLQTWLGAPLAIVRAMPNTPALINCAATGLYAAEVVTPAQRADASAILDAVGITCWVDQEAQLDVVTALSGSGPAYFFYIMEALITAAKKQGLPENIARTLIAQTAIGSGRMGLERKETLEELRKQVTSKGGTTEAGIAVFSEHALDLMLQQALTSAFQRAKELAENMAKNE